MSDIPQPRFDHRWFDLDEPIAVPRWHVPHHDAEILDRWRSALEAGDGGEVERIVRATRADRSRPASRALHDALLGRAPTDRGIADSDPTHR